MPADDIDTGHPHSARIYDYIIGGKDYYPADQEAGDAMVREWPALPVHMRANRDFMNRAVRYLAEEAGYGSSSTSGPGSRRRPTSMRSPSRSPRGPESSTSTTIPLCSAFRRG